MSDTLIDLMRHGEPLGGRRYRGHGIDDPLSDTGWQQMWRAVGDAVPWQHIVSSPLQRCTGFARELASRHELPVTTDSRFREIGFGCWEGLSPDEVKQRDPGGYADFFADPSRNRPAGAESLDRFAARVVEAFDELVQVYTGKHVLVVAHAGVVRAALGYVLKADPVAWYRVCVDTASLTRFRHDGSGLKLEFHNRIHVDG